MKLKHIVLSIFLFIFGWSIFSLSSFAEGGPTGSVPGVQYNYHLPTVIYWTVNPSGYGWDGTLQNEAYARNREDGLCFIQISNTQTRVASVDYLLFENRDPYPGNTYLTKSNFVGSNSNGDADYTKNPVEYPPGHWVSAGSFYANNFIINHPSGYQITFTGGPRFDSEQSARAYITTGDRNGLISGGDSLDELAPIEWGPGGSPTDPGSTPDDSIPAPQIQVVNVNGQGTHKIRILNNEFDDRLQANGTYGVVCSCIWFSCNDFSFKHDGLLEKKYAVYYDSLVYGSNSSYLYNIPYREGQINLCPRYIDFDQDQISQNNYATMLSQNPLSNRNITVPASNPSYRDYWEEYLTPSSCPYNSCSFSLYFYKKDETTGKYSFGPFTQGLFSIPNQGVVFDFYKLAVDPNPGPGDVPGIGGGYDPDPNPVVPPIPTVPGAGDVDASNLYNNMRSILTLIGSIPEFIGELFSFLPPWVLTFLGLAIALMVAIGIFKFFTG